MGSVLWSAPIVNHELGMLIENVCRFNGKLNHIKRVYMGDIEREQNNSLFLFSLYSVLFLFGLFMVMPLFLICVKFGCMVGVSNI